MCHITHVRSPGTTGSAGSTGTTESAGAAAREAFRSTAGEVCGRSACPHGRHALRHRTAGEPVRSAARETFGATRLSQHRVVDTAVGPAAGRHIHDRLRSQMHTASVGIVVVDDFHEHAAVGEKLRIIHQDVRAASLDLEQRAAGMQAALSVHLQQTRLSRTELHHGGTAGIHSGAVGVGHHGIAAALDRTVIGSLNGAVVEIVVAVSDGEGAVAAVRGG